MATRLDDYLSARARSRYLEAALARASGKPALADSLRAEALVLEERAQRVQRLESAAHERRTRAGVSAMLDRIDDLKAKGRLDAG